MGLRTLRAEATLQRAMVFMEKTRCQMCEQPAQNESVPLENDPIPP